MGMIYSSQMCIGKMIGNKSTMRTVVCLLLCVFFSGYCFAQLGVVPMNTGHDAPSYATALGNTCPRPVNCADGASFLTLSAANQCGCCTCNGGAVGCAGGGQGQIVCADGTYASQCKCQYTVNTD